MLVTSIPQYVQGITNAKVDLTNTNDTVLYTAPSDADFNASIVNSILVSNDSGSADTITVTLVSGSDTFSLFKLEEVGAVSSKELLLKDLILQSGEIIKVQAATGARLHVVASIQEITKQRITTSALANI
tara:strand:- start:14576 stop:14965 length:390 start_codon:yes stop_codon:yes gene_type:complete